MSWWTADIIAIDTETTGLSWINDKVFGVAIAWLEAGQIKSEYFDIRKAPAKYQRLRDKAPNLRKIVNHNIKFDMHMLLNDGVELNPAVCECTMMRAALIDEHLFQYNLDALAKKYLGKEKYSDIYQELADMFGGKATRTVQMKNLHMAPAKMVAPYACPDAELALELFLWQEEEMERQELAQIYQLEQRLFPYVFRMEREGIRVDLDAAEQRTEMLTAQIDRTQKELDKAAGTPINCNPSQSIHNLFEPRQDENGRWIAIDGTPLGTTGAGKASINAEALEAMKHPCAKMILTTRKLLKVRDTFIGGHILGHNHNGRVHPNINQTKGDSGGTGTGRLSYTGPALQQIPSRDRETAMIVRPIFLPEEGQGWSYGDLDQHELRIFHHYVNSPAIINAYDQNPDLDGHEAVAKLTGLPRNPQSGGKSSANAKQMNLGMIFNMGGGELADVMGLPFTYDSFKKGNVEHVFKKAGPEAQRIIDDYYQMVPGVREIAQKARSIAKARGYVKTLMGRHIRFPQAEFVYKASGLVYQGGAADLNKDNIIRIFEYLDSECPEGRLMLNIHDEYSISMPFGGAKQHLINIKEEIQRRPEIRVPIRIDFSEPSSNWWDATIADQITK